MTDAPFRPTEYTAALLKAVRSCLNRLRARARPVQVLELGPGSGVVLAAMLLAGAEHGVGVDIEPAAVNSTRALLEALGLAGRAELRQGDLWSVLEGMRFDLIAFNPPQFPSPGCLDDGRLPTWSWGGPDGRAVLDPFLRGLPQHLAADGVALLTHNLIVDVTRTLDMLQALGLQAEIASTTAVPLAPEKARALTSSVFDRHQGSALQHVGPYLFTDFHVLEIRHSGRPGANV